MRSVRGWFALGVVVGWVIGLRWVARRGLRITPPWLAPLLTSRARLIYRAPSALIRLLAPQLGWRVLDLGCGNGVMTLPLAAEGCVVFALDVQQPMLRALQRRTPRALAARVFPCQAQASWLPFCDAAFDAVVMIAVLPMLPSPARALGEVRRVLKPGGVLVVGEEVFSPEYVLPTRTQRWLEEAGFRVERVQRAALQYLVRSRAPL